jgi:hypothetical protein
MPELKEKFHIVPKGDGYHVLAKSPEGAYYLHRKATGLDDNVLIFDTEGEALRFLVSVLDDPTYQVERFWQKVEDESND